MAEALRRDVPLDAADGLDAADRAFHELTACISLLVRLVTDEMIPLGPDTLKAIKAANDQIQRALPVLADWRGGAKPTADWTLEPPFQRAAVDLSSSLALTDIENVERLRRSLELLAPRSLALRREPAIVVVDALLHELRCRVSSTGSPRP